MSHSIIFETKIVKLKDGRLLHLDRSGCNNDDSGRTRDDFTGKIYSIEDFIKKAESYKSGSKPAKGWLTEDGYQYWELKIGSKLSTAYDYGQHLLRMFAKAVGWDEFVKDRYVYGKSFDGARMYKPFEGDVSVEEFNKNFYDWMYSKEGLSYHTLSTRYYKEDEIISAIDGGKPMSFYVSKQSRAIK